MQEAVKEEFKIQVSDASHIEFYASPKNLHKVQVKISNSAWPNFEIAPSKAVTVKIKDDGPKGFKKIMQGLFGPQ